MGSAYSRDSYGQWEIFMSMKVFLLSMISSFASFFLSLTLFPTEQLAGSVNETSALQKHSTIHLVIACHSSCRGLHCSLRVGVCPGYFVSVFLPLLLMGWVGNRAHEKFPVLAFTTLIFEINQYICSSCLTKKQIHVLCCNLSRSEG